MQFIRTFFSKKPDPLVRPVDLAIANGVHNLMAFTEVEREEIMNGIAARAFTEKRHVHINPKKNGRNPFKNENGN